MKHFKSKSYKKHCTANDLILTDLGLGCINCGAVDNTHAARSVNADAHTASTDELDAASAIFDKVVKP